MTGYDYMMRPRRLELRIRRICLQIEELESCLLPQGIRYDKDKVQTSSEDQLSKVAARILELEKVRDQMIHERALLILEVQDNIDTLDSEPERLVLEAYFLSRMSMVSIAEMMHYSLRQTFNIRTKALQKIARFAR